jgi:DNA polymerase III delta subunit
VAKLTLISGEEEFLVERTALQEATSSLSKAVYQFKLPNQLSSYLQESSMIPKDGCPRVFILWGADDVPILSSFDDDVIVVSKKKLSHASCCKSYDFPKLKSFDDKNEYLGWIIKEGENFNIDLARVAVGLFVNSRKSLRKIFSEIRKISVLVPSGVVTPEDVKAVLCFSAELTPKEVLDAICEGRSVKALAFLDKLQENNDETGWVIAFLQRHVIQMLLIERLRSSGLSGQEISEKIGVHPFVYRKMVEPKVGLWDQSSLLRSLDTLCNADLLHKIGNSSAELILEAEIVRLSEEALNDKRGRS